MATEFLREKINILRNNVQAEALQIFQHQLLVDAAAATTGDKQVDQAMSAQAEQSRTVIMGSKRRLDTYLPKLGELEAELASQDPKAAA
jgi:hypothetical protein